MTGTLPAAGLRVRGATLDDAKAIFEVQAAHNVPIIGDPNATLEDVADELVEPGFDPAIDSWLVERDSGERPAIGWGWACRKGASANVDIAVYAHPGEDATAAWLFDAVQRRAVEIARELGHPEVTIDLEAFREDGVRRALAQAHGYAPATTFFRLLTDHDGEVPYPQLPDLGGATLTLRAATDDADVRRDAHAIRNAGFAGHFGFVPDSFAEWVERREASSVNDWALVHVGYVDGVPATVLIRNNSFVPDENRGYVHILATAPAYQGRGLGRYLLRYAFAADAAAGRVGTLLHVDTDPSRPALGFYLSAGMRPILTIDVWRRRLPT